MRCLLYRQLDEACAARQLWDQQSRGIQMLTDAGTALQTLGKQLIAMKTQIRGSGIRRAEIILTSAGMVLLIMGAQLFMLNVPYSVCAGEGSAQQLGECWRTDLCCRLYEHGCTLACTHADPKACLSQWKAPDHAQTCQKPGMQMQFDPPADLQGTGISAYQLGKCLYKQPLTS